MKTIITSSLPIGLLAFLLATSVLTSTGRCAAPTTVKAAPSGSGFTGLLLEEAQGRILISGIMPGSPAAEQPDLHKGDRVIAIGQGEEPSVPVADKSLGDVISLVRGKVGSKVSLTLAEHGGSAGKGKVVTLTRIEFSKLPLLSSLKAGDVAPAYEPGVSISGEPVRILEKGRVYFIECWATWCRPCVASIPLVESLHRRYSERGLTVIGQNIWQDDEVEVRKFVADQGDKMTYRVVMDKVDPASQAKDGPISLKWVKGEAGGSYGIPISFLVGKDGKIAWVGHPDTLKDATIEAALADVPISKT